MAEGRECAVDSPQLAMRPGNEPACIAEATPNIPMLATG
jgi:hypothetical protein